jgi:hypothetical protein
MDAYSVFIFFLFCLFAGVFSYGTINPSYFGEGILLDKYEQNGTMFVMFDERTLIIPPKYAKAMTIGQQYSYYYKDGVIISIKIPYDTGL